MEYFSMFSGIGGFEFGIQRAYNNSKIPGLSERRELEGIQRLQPNPEGKYGRQFPTCVGYSEIDTYAITTYEKHFKGYENYGDATRINPERIQDFDLLTGGFPCQAFSIAGKRNGFDDTRGTLFFDIARILAVKRPRHLVLENVRGLLSHDSGKTFQTILGVLTELGYIVEWQVLNSKNFGVPQNRERVYIVGHLRDRCRRKIFPIRGSGGANLQEEGDPQGQGKRLRGQDISAAVDANYHKGPGSTRQMIEEPFMVHNVYGGFKETKVREFHGISPTIRTPKGGGHLPMIAIPEATKRGYAVAEPGDSINISQPNSKTRRGRVGKGVAQTLETGHTQATIHGRRIRRLTPVECERLQGFPDNWTLGSDMQRYKQVGNAVTINVVEAVMRKLKPCLEDV